MANLGTVVMTAKAFRKIIEDERERAIIARQQAYDATMEMLSENVGGAELDELILKLTSEGLAGLMSQRPDVAAQVLRRAGEQMQNA